MLSAACVRFAVGVIGNIISLFLFLSPLPTFMRIWKKKSVEQYSPTPYLVTFMNCMFWAIYGLPFVHPNSILVATITGTGCLIELSYLFLFVIYSDEKNRLKLIAMTLGEVALVGVVVMLVLTLAHTTNHRSQIIGFFGIASAIVMYAAPLSIMKQVIKTKSVEYMPLCLSVASFANALVWSFYASLHPFDPYVATPNGLGCLFGLAQLMLYMKYHKSTKEQLAARKGKADVALGEVIVGARDSSKVNDVPQKDLSTPNVNDT